MIPHNDKEMTAEEVWMDIKPYGYRVSNMGMVSGKRKEFLKPMISRQGYARVCLRDRQFVSYKTIHSLVAEYFIGPRKNGMTINHKDGNKLNNNLENLEYVTLQKNLEHGWNIGRKCEGDRHGMRKLNSTEVGEIRQLRMSGLMIKEIAKSYGVAKCTVSDIVHNRTWKCIRSLKKKGAQ